MINDIIRISVLAFGVGFIGAWVIGTALKFFVALKSPPKRRAAWIVGLGYLISTTAMVFLPIDLGNL